MGSTGIGNGIAIPHGKLEEDTLRAVGVFVQLETPIAFDAIDNQPVDLLLPCWCRQTKLNAPAYSVAGGETSGGQNHLPPFTRSPER